MSGRVPIQDACNSIEYEGKARHYRCIQRVAVSSDSGCLIICFSATIIDFYKNFQPTITLSTVMSTKRTSATCDYMSSTISSRAKQKPPIHPTSEARPVEMPRKAPTQTYHTQSSPPPVTSSPPPPTSSPFSYLTAVEDTFLPLADASEIPFRMSARSPSLADPLQLPPPSPSAVVGKKKKKSHGHRKSKKEKVAGWEARREGNPRHTRAAVEQGLVSPPRTKKWVGKDGKAEERVKRVGADLDAGRPRQRRRRYDLRG